ncbi:hypothetical protein Ade02nite_63960 [Paractinoplanes deccanensis]|uniref:LigA protein n=1 Tax=Paractinoplanes deccanensis TaxID=113561 RepID=A0ABQ3YCV2_9ACTN|nr:hypothetical protein [Actinoplanes deccanensis]GID77755.1 hypothetical protein Ade02nite_63960 [Actinoplanes deccanensis]
MKQLSDLMREAVQTDAPPLRHSVDDVVAAGKSRTRRRAAGWTSLAVVAVVAAIGVPQAVLHRAGPARPDIAPATSAPPNAEPPTVAYTFKGYTAGDLRVADPNVWRLDLEEAAVVRGEETVGSLDVYRAGVDPRRIYHFEKVTATDPIEGRPAVVIGDGALRERLAWQYAPGAWAVAAPRDQTPLDELRQLAEAFRPSRAYGVTVPFRAAVPGGLRIISITTSGDRARVTAATDKLFRRMLADQDRQNPEGAYDNVSDGLTLEIGPSSSSPLRPAGTKAICTEPAHAQPCVKFVAGDRYVVQAQGPPTATRADVAGLLDGVSVTDPADPSTWVPADEAFPASALPPRN